ncbi:single-stranded DNA-binding protein [candidate division KSB3 bacterium]|nr:single-stranded DNA-binding protein [candidate division KSB3 bacterium]
MNTVNLIGNLTRDVELKHTNTGTAIGSLSLAVNEKFKKGDEWQERASFIDCTLFGRRAEGLAPYLVKGTKIGITGKLRQDRWQNQEGQNRSKINVLVDDVDLLSENGKGKLKREDTDSSSFEDDIPF